MGQAAGAPGRKPAAGSQLLLAPAEMRAAEQYSREAGGADQDQYSAYGRSALSGDLRRMDAQRLRDELYENCLTLRAQVREAEEAAAVKNSPAAAALDEAEEAEPLEPLPADAAEEDFEDIIVPPPMQ